jgi:hypothetical protein
MCESQLGRPAADEQPATAGPSIGQIFREYGPAYRAKHAGRIPPEQLRVMGQLERCRTGDLGHAWYRCDNCGTVHAMPQSCGNRHCPQCQGHKAKQWLEGQLEKLLPCAYFLITFTLPLELHRLARAHPRECYQALELPSPSTLHRPGRSDQRRWPTLVAQPRRFLRPGQSRLSDLSRQIPALTGCQWTGRTGAPSDRRQTVGGSQQGCRRRAACPPLSGTLRVPRGDQ